MAIRAALARLDLVKMSSSSEGTHVRLNTLLESVTISRRKGKQDKDKRKLSKPMINTLRRARYPSRGGGSPISFWECTFRVEEYRFVVSFSKLFASSGGIKLRLHSVDAEHVTAPNHSKSNAPK